MTGMTSLNGEPDGKVIHVSGDATADWLMLLPSLHPDDVELRYQWEMPRGSQLTVVPGGAAMLTTLLETTAALLGNELPVHVEGVTIPEELLREPENAAVTRTYARWQPSPREMGSQQLVWRQIEFLGVQPGSPDRAPAPVATSRKASCLVLDDSNLGFRTQPAAWPPGTKGADSVANIVLKMTNPLSSGALWDTLLAHQPSSLTVHCTLGDLRKDFAPVGQALSWERLGTEVAEAVRGHRGLSQAARVVISVGLGGAVLVERNGASYLIFDPLHQEGDWESRRPGTPIGVGTCITAALAIEAVRHEEHPDWGRAIRSGLAAARATFDSRVVEVDRSPVESARFPFRLAAEVLTSPNAGGEFRSAKIPGDREWTMVTTLEGEGYSTIAARMVIEGEERASGDLPIERVGAWVSIDRAEIEGLRSVRNIADDYVHHPYGRRPLSLAVFGPPGSGKSFAIKQLARSWVRSGTAVDVLEVNMSQIEDSSELPLAFQRVRDSVVAGSLPVVFWDEFDTALHGEELGWLAHFLAPMQDGTFAERGLTRPIGPAIFIFAGGTHARMAGFKEHALQRPSAKATDFLSRLRGFVDIAGPNPLDANDETYLLRRALLLRGMLSKKAPGLIRNGRLDSDPGVIRAFLHTVSYLHGARSLEAVVDMSALAGTLRFERSSLPPPDQLGLHVDAGDFLRLVQSAS